jgi:Flavin reductase like domain
MLLITTIKVETSFAYVTQSSSGIAAADPSYCDKAGHYATCYDMDMKEVLLTDSKMSKTALDNQL